MREQSEGDGRGGGDKLGRRCTDSGFPIRRGWSEAQGAVPAARHYTALELGSWGLVFLEGGEWKVVLLQRSGCVGSTCPGAQVCRHSSAPAASGLAADLLQHL